MEGADEGGDVLQIPEDPKKSSRFNLEFLNPIIKPHYEKGLRLFRPVEALEGHDQEEWNRRHMSVLRTEQQIQALSEAFRDLVDAQTSMSNPLVSWLRCVRMHLASAWTNIESNSCSLLGEN